MAIVDKMYECFGRGDMATLTSDVFADEILWVLPGRNPLSGPKRGAHEVIAFFGALIGAGVNVDDVAFGMIGDDQVVERHTGHGTVDGRELHLPDVQHLYDPRQQDRSGTRVLRRSTRRRRVLLARLPAQADP